MRTSGKRALAVVGLATSLVGLNYGTASAIEIHPYGENTVRYCVDTQEPVFGPGLEVFGGLVPAIVGSRTVKECHYGPPQ